MERKQMLATIGVIALLLLAGCTGGTQLAHEVRVYDQSTEIEPGNGNAVWTWSADVDPPSDESKCDIKFTLTLYNESGGVIAEDTTVIRDVTAGSERRSISYIGSAEEINNIVNYDLSVAKPQC